ncbi:unnamed protein product [Parascedosporium putredinis]|uniref:Uncharacterized protein n=1 Tax=Parascedosporium putredinis TaxID=1442378 RepID=A0A9P1MC23_9PEZI|nr:unnamed protein product [Parascedosporium putredinis]CAI7996877.1 unnamed protein product [Parascedosporium putredinis]
MAADSDSAGTAVKFGPVVGRHGNILPTLLGRLVRRFVFRSVLSAYGEEPCPTAISFGDATCAVYFDEFVSLVCSPWISAACHGDWWKIMLPQLARSNIYLYHAAISVGALSKWHQRAAHTDAAPRPLLPAPGSAAEMESDPHYLRAIAHYCQALRLQRKGASTTDALFLSILLVCFETLRGNNKTALAHVNHGLALLLSVVSDVGPGERMGAALAPNPRPVLGAVADIFVNLAGQARSVLPGRLAEGAPFPNFTKGLRKKKQTIESFMITLSELPHCSVTVDNVPEVFTSLDQFEQYWLALGRKQVNVSAVLMEVVRSSGMLSVNATDDLNNFYQNLLGNQRITEICEELTALMLTLGNAFTPLFNSIIMTEGVHSPLYFRALYLRLQFIASYLFQNPSFYLRVEYLQAQTPYFREYLTMAQLALRAVRREIKHPAQQLSLQCLMSSHLLLVAFFCREPLAREEALNLLEDYPVQDGVWNVRSLYQLGVRNRDVERRNTLEGSPTAQWERLRRREYLFEEGGTRVIFRFMDNVDDLGAWELVEEAGELSEDQKHMRWTRQPLTGSGRLLMVDLVNV